MDFNKVRDNRVAVSSAGPYANHLHLTTPASHHSSFTSRCFSWHPANSVKAPKAIFVLVCH